MSQHSERLRRRVVSAADDALARQHYVVPVEILVDLQWLPPRALAEWRQGQIPMLERAVQANLSKISDAMHLLRSWAVDKGLRPSETAYVSRTRDRHPLRFSISGNPEIERAYRTHWVSPALGARKQERLREKQSRPPDLVVIAPLNTEWKCSECGEIAPTDFLLMEDAGPLCLACADLDRLVFLPSGDAALTRRSVKASTLHAVVVRFSRARTRYERQGVLVQENALEQAESECLADADLRARRRERADQRVRLMDESFAARFAEAIRVLFPACPPSEATTIARHASQRRSGRVGRSADGRALAPEAVRLAVAAAVRHAHTNYDALLARGTPRSEARRAVEDSVRSVLSRWMGGSPEHR